MDGGALIHNQLSIIQLKIHKLTCQFKNSIIAGCMILAFLQYAIHLVLNIEIITEDIKNDYYFLCKEIIEILP
jgi:hypothetical protein